MTETTVNIPLLRKAVEWAEAEAAKPDPQDCRWFQGQWLVKRDCGTSYCIAGYVGQSLDERYAKTDTVDGVRVDEFAANALGLDIVGCDGHCTCEVELFDAKNSIADVRRIAESIAGERL